MGISSVDPIVLLLGGILIGATVIGAGMGALLLERQAHLEEVEAAKEAVRESEKTAQEADQARSCSQGEWSEQPDKFGLVRMNTTDLGGWRLSWQSEVRLIPGSGFLLDEMNQTIILDEGPEVTGQVAIVLQTSTNQSQLLLPHCKSIQAHWVENETLPGVFRLSADPFHLRIEHADPGCPKREIGPGATMEREHITTGLLAGQRMQLSYVGTQGGCPSATINYEYEGPWTSQESANQNRGDDL